MIIYRILSLLVTIICSFFAMLFLGTIFLALANPGVLFQCFLMAGVVLYGWFSNRFLGIVLIAKKQMTKKQKDWLQANAIVAFIFSLMCIFCYVAVMVAPDMIQEQLQQVPSDTPVTMQMVVSASYLLLSVGTVIFAHIIWTYILIRKHKQYFLS